MTARPPTRRLVDVLKQNSKRTLERHATELAAAASSLYAEDIQTRFLRNQFLINPKALQLLRNDDLLTRWHVFGLYKPPFCPMRKRDASDNYHHVSVESFVESALHSKSIYPLLRRTLSPAEVQVRVLYNLDAFASGPVLVSLSNHYRFATSLATTTMEYDVLVSGHLPVHATGNHTKMDMRLLFPSVASGSDCSSAQTSSNRNAGATTETDSTGSAGVSSEAYYEVKENGYYSVHPVSLLNVVVRAPPTSQPPALERFAREQLGTCVVGDPLVVGELMQLREYSQASSRSHGLKSQSGGVDSRTSGAEGAFSKATIDEVDKAATRDAAAHAAAVKLAANPHIVSMRGDCDFPRVFMHLREVRVDTSAEQLHLSTTVDNEVATNSSANSGAYGGGGAGGHVAFSFPLNSGASPLTQQQQDTFAQNQGIELHCRKCFNGLVQKQLSSSVKSRRIGLLDGTWTPQTEYL